MQKITFENLPSTNTPLSAQNLNLLQDNAEDEIDEHSVVVSPTEPVTDGKKVWLQHGKNLFNGNNLGTITSIGVTATPNGSKITLTGTSNTQGGIYTTQYLCTLKAGTYILSSSIESGNTSGSGSYAISLRNSDGSWIVDNGNSFTLTNDKAVYLRIYVNASGLTFNNLVLKMQLEQGSEATEYEPYVEDKTYILNDNNVYEEFSEIESGNNLIKFPDGTLIQYGTAMTTNGWTTVTFPISFISTPVITTGSNAGTFETATLVATKTANIGTSSFRVAKVLSNGYDTSRVDWIAIGKWK